MRVARAYLGLERDEMAAALGVRIQSYQRFENGRDPINSGMWEKVDQLYRVFDRRVGEIVKAANEVDGPYRVRVWRGANNTEPVNGMWLRIVSEAKRQASNVLPRYPQDFPDHPEYEQ